jgi:glucose-6-phosphate 1-dehydrogenase
MVTKNTEPSTPAAPGCVLAIFGITGDLTKRLLLPSIFNLALTKSLHKDFRVLGIGRKPWTDAILRRHVTQSLRQYCGKRLDGAVLRWLLERTFYQQANFDEAASFVSIRDRIKQLGKGTEGGSCIFYLALAPNFVSPISRHLATAGLFKESEAVFRRLVVEKPFGHDFESAHELNRQLLKVLREEQIYRIDHFAGKDAVQDLAVFRFHNSIIEPLWHRSLIDNVQITVAETVGLEGRAEFYEHAGALRDMVPNHLAELISLIAMEPPLSFTAKHFRDKQVELLDSIRTIKPSDAVRAQYGAGTVAGKRVKPYRQEDGVSPRSRTETFVALRLYIDNWRWSGVPFYLRTGKSLSQGLTEIAVHFRPPPRSLMPKLTHESRVANQLVFTLQPSPSLHWCIGTKPPGIETRVAPSDMAYQFPIGPYGEHPKGYERLLYDAMCGNAVLFQSAEFAEAGWRMVQPLLDAWAGGNAGRLPVYPAGSAGPRAADQLLSENGHSWRRL